MNRRRATPAQLEQRRRRRTRVQRLCGQIVEIVRREQGIPIDVIYARFNGVDSLTMFDIANALDKVIGYRHYPNPVSGCHLHRLGVVEIQRDNGLRRLVMRERPETDQPIVCPPALQPWVVA